MKKEVVIVGGGASGLVAAIYAASNSNNHVTILERNQDCGKKLLVTGNGRCNYWNEDQSISHYHSKNKELLDTIISFDNQQEIISLFNRIGIIPKIKNGYYYPFSNQALTVKNALLLEAEKNNVEIRNNFLVEKIEKNNNKFIISSNNQQILSDALILATGSFASPKTGSTGMGYQFLEKFGHSLIKPLPALVQLKAEDKCLKDWQGIRTDVLLTIKEQDKVVVKEEGEIQLTNYGISGICTFNISHYVTRKLEEQKEVFVSINFLPFLTESKEQIYYWFMNRNILLKNPTLEKLLDTVLNYKLVNAILKKTSFPKNASFNELLEEEQYKLIEAFTNFQLKVIGTNSFEEAQVCNGGIPLDEINLHTMESTKEENLFITGELLDVAGDCGGYNLSFAWITGMLAGKNV